MSKRSIEICVITTFGNGDEGLTRITKIPVPKYITRSRGSSDSKDMDLEAHIEWLKDWIKSAIEAKELDDERANVMDSW